MYLAINAESVIIILPTMKHIIIRGARTHNLKNLNVDLPRDKLIVITGFQVRVNLLWHLIPCMLKVSGAMSNLSHPMRGNFYR